MSAELRGQRAGKTCSGGNLPVLIRDPRIVVMNRTGKQAYPGNERHGRGKDILEDYFTQHPIVTRKLRECGWSEDRYVNTAQQVDFLSKLHININPLARAAMRNLCGLQIELPNGGISRLIFDPVAAVFSRDYVNRVERIVDCTGLTPIGAGGGYVILLAPHGQAFLLQDEWLCLIGFETLGDLIYFAITGNQTVCHDFVVD